MFLLDFTGIKVYEDWCKFSQCFIKGKCSFFYAPLECVKLWAWNFFLNLICRSVSCVQFWTRGQTSAYNITCAGLERYCYYHWLELRPTWKLLSICHASHVGRLCTRQNYLFCGSPSQPLRWRVYSYCSAGVVKCFALG